MVPPMNIVKMAQITVSVRIISPSEESLRLLTAKANAMAPLRPASHNTSAIALVIFPYFLQFKISEQSNTHISRDIKRLSIAKNIHSPPVSSYGKSKLKIAIPKNKNTTISAAWAAPLYTFKVFYCISGSRFGWVYLPIKIPQNSMLTIPDRLANSATK